MWDYKVVELHSRMWENDTLDLVFLEEGTWRSINELGREGWELLNMLGPSGTYVRFGVFKRPAPSAQGPDLSDPAFWTPVLSAMQQALYAYYSARRHNRKQL